MSTPVFEGPFDLLLHLIMREEVDIHEISLSRIVDGYLQELSRMQELDLEIATEFLLIAATLVELKSRRLLPRRESIELDEELALWEERDLLLSRLVECKMFKDVGRLLAGFVDVADRTFFRSTGPDDRFNGVAPDPLEGMTVTRLQSALLNAITPRPKLSVATFHISPIRFTVAETVARLARELPAKGTTTFRGLTSGLMERLEIVVVFLAILEMYKQGVIDINQADRFGDISVKWSGDEMSGDVVLDVDSYEG